VVGVQETGAPPHFVSGCFVLAVVLCCSLSFSNVPGILMP
jgi:hypothetical protein